VKVFNRDDAALGAVAVVFFFHSQREAQNALTAQATAQANADLAAGTPRALPLLHSLATTVSYNP
jgi:hypothetical protein